ncbi:MAG TPA: YcaO-like family protein [Ktedonobacteraceae bacterium]|nr:YcaO-like family protein [Ktedonobacteraceae bacterium]
MSIDSREVRSRNLESSAADEKAVQVGTHRACSPEATLARVLPLLPAMGITRVAEVTRLDDLGIPVFQAIRPNSRNLSVSQGKGITRQLAKVSAIMESIETWHAEEPSLPSTRGAIGEMAACLPYSIYDLNLVEHCLLHDSCVLDWFPGTILGSWEQTFVPTDYIRLDFTTTNEWLPPTFELASNGLASGNTLEEAILHGLYEVVERDTFAQARVRNLQEVAIDPATVDGEASAPLIEQLSKAGADCAIFSVSGPTGIACFGARIISSNYPIVAIGYGCHLDRDVALSRALTEAAQSRLTMISGARDDIDRRTYARIRSRHPLVKMDKGKPLAAFQDIPSLRLARLKEDLDEVTRRLLSAVSCPPIIVDLTRPELMIPVVFVVAPQLRSLEAHA